MPLIVKMPQCLYLSSRLHKIFLCDMSFDFSSVSEWIQKSFTVRSGPSHAPSSYAPDHDSFPMYDEKKIQKSTLEIIFTLKNPVLSDTSAQNTFITAIY